MAELYPEECRFSIHWVGQWRQVGDLSPVLSSCSSTSSLSFQPPPISTFSIPPSLDHIKAPKVPKIAAAPVKWRLFKILHTINDSGGSKEGLECPKWGEWGWSSWFYSIPAHPRGIWEKERGYIEGDRGADHWFLCDTWEISLDFPLSLSVFALLLETLSACDHVFCLLLCLTTCFFSHSSNCSS